ncbi:c-type cytochrome [Catalinimonas niigatensis]|uniref:c-type cytochrome n=1 Tax=Catalinimonas niigatensis TaxID=1397264 RepID=UPI0026652320|nr:c-type cytochrome [Catalinimonas niigatensis]WPP50346.1 c-type cytochrome [Catalinimonas niigatensis]
MYRKFTSMKLLLAISVLILMGTSYSSINTQKPAHEKEENPKIDKLKLQDGFHAEHLYSPSENEEGSWVGMTFDDQGRLITSDQYGFLYRMEVAPIGSDSLTPKIEKLRIQTKDPVADSVIQMGYAQGLLWAFNSLYVMVNHESDEKFDKNSGLYRLQDTDGDDQFDKISLLKELGGEPGEHGPHSIVLSPDKQSLYVVAGNHTDVPKMDAYRLPPVWDYDNLFPEIKDPRGHANDREAPGGWIAKIDPQGEHWELISAGYRNPFDLAFNEAGDLFTYDSDMEWDFGMPWYRPTRICHVTSGSEYGWRTGNGKWLPAYPDNLPALLNIGQGSPTNLVYGGKSHFPDKYRKAMYAFDWSFGIIYSINLQPEGASYHAEAEEFISGSPLPLTDGVIGPDGALYFLTGGRRLESDLYRIYHDDYNSNFIAEMPAATGKTEEQKIREQLEQYHTGKKAGAIDFAWPYLNHEDRFIRYAARIAVEHQPLNQWKDRALNEKDPQIKTQAIIALARHGKKSLNSPMLKSLMGIDYGQLADAEKVDLLRAFELVLFRQGTPNADVKAKLIAYLDAHYPAEDNTINRSLSKLMVALDAPQVVSKTLAILENAEDDDQSGGETVTASSDLILRNPQYGLDIAGMLAKVPPAQQTYYATVLSEAKAGWTPELREEYFKWYYDAFNYKGGRSYIGFVDKARQAALSHVPKDKHDYYNTLSGDSLLSSNGNDLADVPQPEGPGRKWTVEEALPFMDSLSAQNLERGKSLFAATLCLSCHTMKGEGGAVGPDLTQLGNRFTPKDILEATIEPNEVISDQYAATVFSMKDGKSILGRLTNEDENNYYISQNPFAPQNLREIPKSEVVSTKTSEVSVMLPGLVNRLNPEELKDLMAYLISAGNENHEVYKASEKSDNGKE